MRACASPTTRMRWATRPAGLRQIPSACWHRTGNTSKHDGIRDRPRESEKSPRAGRKGRWARRSDMAASVQPFHDARMFRSQFLAAGCWVEGGEVEWRRARGYIAPAASSLQAIEHRLGGQAAAVVGAAEAPGVGLGGLANHEAGRRCTRRGQLRCQRDRSALGLARSTALIRASADAEGVPTPRHPHGERGHGLQCRRRRGSYVEQSARRTTLPLISPACLTTRRRLPMPRPLLLGDSLTVELSALDRAVLVRIRSPPAIPVLAESASRVECAPA